MKRVLHIIGGMNRAGAETMIMNIYRAIDRSKFQFDFLVYSNNRQDYESEIESLGGRVIHMPMTGSLGECLKSVIQIRRIVKDYGPFSAIHAATLHNSAFALLATLGTSRCRKIVHSHSTANTVSSSVIKRIYNVATKWIIRALTDEYVACGDEAGQYLFGKRLFRQRGIVINNSVDVDRFYDVKNESGATLKEEFGITDEIVIGSVARLNEVKNHKRMLEIASELKRRGNRFKMILVGRGNLENEIRKELTTRELNDYVILAGVRDDIPELMHLFDVFLMPSFFEGNPVTLIEAQAAGLPAVISDSITDKIDMGLDLIHRVSLAEDNGKWVDTILSAVQTRRSPKGVIVSALKKHGYDLHRNVERLCKIYDK